MNRPGVVTVGSINVDLTVKAARRPFPGETMPGESFTIQVGGKGLNQAVQAAVSGASSFMVGRIGDDVFAPLVTDLLDRCGVNREYVKRDPAGTGIGSVVIDAAGDYSTIIVARANGNLSPADVEDAIPAIHASKVLLLQLETPLDTAIYAARIAHEAGLRVFLNAAPASPVPGELLRNVDVLIVNELEAATLAGVSFDPDDPDQVSQVVAVLSQAAREVVVTLGPRGMVGRDRYGQELWLKGHQVQVVNTVGAGDAAIGELAARMAEGMSLLEALPYANAAGAVATARAEPYGHPGEVEIIRKLASMG